MELKVWVEGIQRIVCGVTENTTCQDVVFALAQATGKSGRFTLLERWRSNERYLEPNEYPLKILLKLGEYSNDVQFILQWNQVKKPVQLLPLEKKMLLFSDPPHGPNLTKEKPPPKTNAQSISSDKPFKPNPTMLDIQEFFGSPVKSDHHPDTILTDLKKTHEHSSSIAPPPYRHPPPPNLSQDNTNHLKCKNNNLLQEFHHKNTEIVFYSYNTQYRNLIHLVNYQREKLTTQQSDITKLDAELIVWEEKCRDQNRQMEFLQEELKLVGNKIDHEQLQALNKVGEENELVKQQHKTLKSEITLLRSKISNCETELLQAKQKIRLLMDELQKAHMLQIQRSQSQKHMDEIVLADLDHLQEQIIFAKENTELNHFTAETLKREVATLKSSMFAKRKQVEDLVTELKEANLQSLSIKQSDEVKLLLEGPTKTCSTRKIIGSPRQLENAVPTNKNPHGVWV